ncbi:MAG: hypothetical protein WD512_18190, partial [Candidatus Paceibacterota bacterium]
MSVSKIITLVITTIVVSGSLFYLNSIVNDATLSNINNDILEEEVGIVENNNQQLSEDDQINDTVNVSIFNIAGNIIQVNSNQNYIVINTNGAHMDNNQEIEVRVSITNNTRIVDRINSPTEFSSLSTGQSVIIETVENIRNQTEIEAYQLKINQNITDNNISDNNQDFGDNNSNNELILNEEDQTVDTNETESSDTVVVMNSPRNTPEDETSDDP